MDRRKAPEELTIMEAVDNLSNMADLDVSSPMEEAPEHEEGEAVGAYGVTSWLDPNDLEKSRGNVKETFRVLHDYLKHVYEKDKRHLKDIETQKGIQAIMVLAGEAAQKIDKCTSLFKGAHEKESVTLLKEYQELQQFYLSKIMKRFHETLETEEAWEAQWGAVEDDFVDIQRRGLKDLETVKRDKDYELFFIRKDDGRPFFNRNLLRHIRLVGDFDETVSDPTGEDPLLRIKVIQDKDLHTSAKEILQGAASYVDEFYKEALKHKELEFVNSLNKALMALMLSANSRNLMQNTAGKSCLRYFDDFQMFLREALSSSEYQKFVANPPDLSERFFHALLNLSHALCCFVYMRVGVRKEASELIERLIQRGQEIAAPPPKDNSSIAIWNGLLDDYEMIRHILKRYPNGPLLKTLDVFREGEDKGGFDPILHENIPSQMFVFTQEEMHVTCLRLPSPTRQEFISKVDVIEEFKGFLRFLNSKMGGKKHLLINLQDRTSWEEHNRCIALEELQKQAEFSKSLCVVTIPKNTDFYYQSGPYQEVNQASLFIQQFKDQIKSAEECGFYFPSSLKAEQINQFAESAIDTIHEIFFSKKNVLSRKNRLDFIELFYQFFALKLIEMVEPDSISFTCKDAIDTGIAASGAFYSFLHLMSQVSSFTNDERQFLLWMLHSPALLIRERQLDIQRHNRMVSSMVVLHAELDTQRTKVQQASEKLFKKPLFSKIKVYPAE